MFVRRSATAAACAACWIGAAAHSVAEPAPYQEVRSLLIVAGLAFLLLLIRARRRLVSPITADIADAFAVHATRTRDRITGGWAAPVIPLRCEPAPAHRWLVPAGAAVLVTTLVGGLVVYGWDDAHQQAARPPAQGAPPPAGPPAPSPVSPSPTRRHRDEPPAGGDETGRTISPTSPDSPGSSSARPGATMPGRSARGASREPAPSSTGSGGTSPTSSAAPTTTADGGAEPKPTRTPIRRIIRRVAP